MNGLKLLCRLVYNEIRDINDKLSTLKSVAFSGKYVDLTGLPTIPTSLKNPKALTFTGSVTGSYDGSSDKTVVIPSAPPP